jgi:quinol monooxygenase YgiN
MPEPEQNDALVVVTLFSVKPSHVPDVGELLRDLVESTRAEAGCVSYQALQGRTDPVDFAVVGEWRSEEAYDAHMAAPHTVTFTHRVLGLLESGPEIRRYRVI